MRELLDRLEEKIADIEDSGLGGKYFEKIFVKALNLIGMEFVANIASGPGWDIHTRGDKWLKLISDKDVNIKVCGTKWMLSSSELAKFLPWEKLPDDYDSLKYEKKIRRIFAQKKVSQIYFLKPKTLDIQNQIIMATENEDIDILHKLVVKKNFRIEKLGRGYEIKILDNGKRITSVAIIKDGKVFMRSEKPRSIGGTNTVAFRSPTPKISKISRPITKKEKL
jgi:hypothetical protein